MWGDSAMRGEGRAAKIALLHQAQREGITVGHTVALANRPLFDAHCFVHDGFLQGYTVPLRPYGP